jgi:hypothetical protein
MHHSCLLLLLFPCSTLPCRLSIVFIPNDDDDAVAEATTSTSRSSPGDEDYSDDLSDENSPIEQVALTVPVGDDPSTPVLTFRMWVLGTASCALLSFLNQFFWYRKEPLTITAISAQIAVVPLGRLMAAVLPERPVLRGTRWEFSLNPGPFNVKEHVLITIFANSGAGTVYAIHIITAVRVFYGKNITFFVSLLVVLTTQVLRHGHARPASRVAAAARTKRLAFASFVLRAVRGFTVCHVLCARRCWGSVGREYSGGISWSRRRCGGPPTSCRSPSSGTQLPTHPAWLWLASILRPTVPKI